MKRSHRFIAPSHSLFVVLCVIVIHAPMWLKGHTLGWDAMRESWGDLSYAIQALSEGYFPFWNHLERGGYPFLADPQTAVLYPVNWLIYATGLIFGSGPGLAVMRSLCHYWISAYGCQLLAKRWGASTRLSLLFSLGYTLSGRLLKSKDNAGIWTMVWLPWLVMAVEKLIEKPGRQAASILAVTCTLAFYAGYPPNMARALLLVISWSLYRVCVHIRSELSTEKSIYMKSLGRSLVQSVVYTLVLCGPGLISTLQIIGESERKGLNIAQLISSRFRPIDILDMVSPRLVHSESYALMYCGLVIFVLAISSLWMRSRERGERLFWGGALLVSALWACGQHTPILRLFVEYVPTFNLWRIAEQYAFLTTFSLAILALKCGLSLEEEERRLSSREESEIEQKMLFRSSLFRVSLTLSVILTLIYLYGIWETGDFRSLTGLSAVLCIAMTALWRMKRLTLNSVWAGLCLLSLIDIGCQQQDLVKISQPVPRPRRDHLVQLTGHHRFADEGHLRWRPASRILKPDLLGRYSTMVGQRWAMYRRHSEKSKHLYAWGGVQQLFKRRRSRFERTQHPVPYAYWTPHELRSPNAQQVLGEMKRRSPGDALIAFSEMNDQQESLKVVKGSGIKGSAANVIRSKWGSILLTLDSPEPGILVINEAYSPWWRIQVNGKEWLSTERMNYLFQGIRLPPGHHTVNLEYRETPTLIALPLCISMALYVLWINRRREDRRGTGVNVQPTASEVFS